MRKPSETAVLDRVLHPLAQQLGPEAARHLAELRPDPELEARLQALADKANEGTLSSTEQAEYETYARVINLLTVLQSKARLFLKHHPAA